MTTIDFDAYSLPNPQYDDVVAEYAQIGHALDSASTATAAIDAVQQWDDLRRRLQTWSQVVEIRFTQDTRNAQYKHDLDYRNEIDPKLIDLAVQFKRRLLEGPHRDRIAAHFGEHALNLWRCDLASFDPAIKADLVQQSKLENEYTELIASAQFEFQGEKLNLSTLTKFDERPERAVRRESLQLRWTWFRDNQERLDEIFNSLVHLRQTMAEKLGYENFIAFGYQRMRRTDYGPADVERFRNEVLAEVVPLATELRERQAKVLGVDPLMAWDEPCFDPAGNPQPISDYGILIDRARQMFASLGSGIDELFAQMCDSRIMDLKSRDGKAGGGYCGMLETLGMPFIFANFNGTMFDIRVFTHEMGHAFQVYSSRHQQLEDYLWPTMEACEIHSMGLEFLAWPQMELFFGSDADRFRRLHLTQAILVLPYIVAVDHFQHFVYANPHCSPADRANFWQQMERTYLPHLKWGDLAHPASGRRWQAQLHIYGVPFYYIDYALAQTCALQLWEQSATDYNAVLARYNDLCRRGGEIPFLKLVHSAGLKSPFAAGSLSEAVSHARKFLNA